MTLSSATKVAFGEGVDDDLAAGKPFADVVVGVAFERKRHPFRHECAEALAGRADEVELESYPPASLPCRNVASLRCPTIVPTTRLMFLIGNVRRNRSAAR